MAKNLTLFTPESSRPRNLLPYDGECVYYGAVFEKEAADAYLQYLLTEIPWKNDEIMMYGKHIVTGRKVVWYGDRNYPYRYSHKTRTALPWTRELREIKAVAEKMTGISYNSCLLNLYENGSQGLGWHRDDEKELQEGAAIASVSFGAERRFDMRHDVRKEKVSVLLEHGSLLLMRGDTQKHWKHQVPKSVKISAPRVNLTFRRMLE